MESDADEITRLAWSAEASESWDTAVALWLEIAVRPDADPTAFVRAAQILARHQKFDRADSLLQAALGRHPLDPGLLATYGFSAHWRGNWPEAVQRWAAYRAVIPDQPFGYAIAAAALTSMGSYDAADALCEAALRQFPAHLELLGNFAWSAQGRGNWSEALLRWQAAHERHPLNPVPVAQIEFALRQLGRNKEADALADRATARRRQIEADPGDLFMRFESLGGDCLFGIVQRHFGANPLGLLRFTATSAADLVSALAGRLDGIGEPANTEISVGNGQYLTIDRQYRMTMLTFVKSEDVTDIDRQTEKFLKRLRFLRDKLLEDLEAGEKTFVYTGGASVPYSKPKPSGARCRFTGATGCCSSFRPVMNPPRGQ